MRADRLVSIILLLQRYDTLTAGQLAERLEVSERTILRDMTALSVSGVPVYAERGTKGGFRLVDGYELDLSGLRSSEIRALFLHDNDGVIADLGWKQDADTARYKLSFAIPEEQLPYAMELGQRFHIDETPWFAREKTSSSHLDIIQQAIWGLKRFEMSYQKPDNSTSVRVIAPYALVAKAGVWYLVGERNDEFRVYRASRILDVRVLNESFTRTSSFNLKVFWRTFTQEFEKSRPTYDTLLWIHNSTYPDFVHSPLFVTVNIQPEVITPAPKDFVTVKVTYETMEVACRHILGFGNDIRVIEPLELRTAVIDKARGILNEAVQ